MSTRPERLGKYELHERLGRGGMAEVWKAYDTQLRRFVAIKILHPDLRVDPQFISRFKQEAQLVASLHHPNIVSIHDFRMIFFAPESGHKTACMVMDYIEGQTLADYIHNTSGRGSFPSVDEILYIFRPICDAIDYAHHEGLIHRDIKPANILLDERVSKGKGISKSQSPIGEPVLSDFGIAKLMGVSASTLTSGIIGTPLYISPEQAQGQPGNERSDIYSLGVILYEIFTGVLPFQGNNPLGIMRQHIEVLPTPPHLINPDISPAIASVIMRCLAKNPKARYSSATAMITALEEAIDISFSENPGDYIYESDSMNEPTFIKAPLLDLTKESMSQRNSSRWASTKAKTQRSSTQTGNSFWRSRKNILFITSVGILATLITLGLVIFWRSQGQGLYDTIVYGMPRTYQTDAVVGHYGDSQFHPSHFIVINLNRQVTIIEFMAGDPARAIDYVVPKDISGPGGDLAPVTVSFRDVTGDGKPDMIVDIHLSPQDEIFVFVNDGTKFRPPNANDRIHL